MKRNSGVSMITLVITIIVIIILAAVAFGSSTSTIHNANFSDFVNNVAEVQTALDIKVTTVRGEEGKNGVTRTPAQVYNYVAKGGSQLGHWLPREDAENMECTQLTPAGDMKKIIGMDLPSIRVSTPKSNGVECSYFVTKTGKVFVWPPYVKADGTLWVNGEDKVSGDATDIETYFTDIIVDGVRVDIASSNNLDLPGYGSGDAANDGPTVFYDAENDPNVSPKGRESRRLYNMYEG